MTPEQLDALSDEYLLERLRSGAGGAQAQAFVQELQRRGVTPTQPTAGVVPAEALPRQSRGRLLVQLEALPAAFLILGAIVGGPLGEVMGRSALVAAGVAFVYWVGLGATTKRPRMLAGIVAGAVLVLLAAMFLVR